MLIATFDWAVHAIKLVEQQILIAEHQGKKLQLVLHELNCTTTSREGSPQRSIIQGDNSRYWLHVPIALAVLPDWYFWCSAGVESCRECPLLVCMLLSVSRSHCDTEPVFGIPTCLLIKDRDSMAEFPLCIWCLQYQLKFNYKEFISSWKVEATLSHFFLTCCNTYLSWWLTYGYCVCLTVFIVHINHLSQFTMIPTDKCARK